jgi:hypothetical protein
MKHNINVIQSVWRRWRAITPTGLGILMNEADERGLLGLLLSDLLDGTL